MRRTLLLGSLGLLAGLGVKVDPVASQSADTNAIKAANAAFYSALSARDISAMERIWAKDEQVSNIFSAAKTPSFGPSAIKADYEDLFKRLGDAPSLVMAEPFVRQQGDMALVIGVEAAQVKLPNGDLAKFFPVATNVFVKRDAQWLMVHHHTSRPPQ
jgi:ketosteroid isomerase-like protein